MKQFVYTTTLGREDRLQSSNRTAGNASPLFNPSPVKKKELHHQFLNRKLVSSNVLASTLSKNSG